MGFLVIGYAYEELSEISPDHRFLAYTMYDKENDCFKLSVRDLSSSSLFKKPGVDRVAGFKLSVRDLENHCFIQ